MEAILTWLKSIGEKAVFPGLLVLGCMVLAGFPLIAPNISAIIQPENLRGYAVSMILIGMTGTIVLNFHPAFNWAMEKYYQSRKLRRFHALPLDSKFVITIILAVHQSKITLPGLPSVCVDALVDAGFGFARDKGHGFTVFEFYTSSMPYLRQQRDYLYAMQRANYTAFTSFEKRLKDARLAEESAVNHGWMSY